MNIIKAISYIQYLRGEIISFKDAAIICKKSIATIDKYKSIDITDEMKEALETYFNCKLPCEEASSAELAHNYVDVPYWEECEKLSEKLKKASCTQVCKDMEIAVNDYGSKPENLRIIAMPSDKMDGGIRPIKYGDILIIDTSLTDISYSGIYFFTANDDVFVNRIEKRIDGIVFSFYNELTANITYSFDELKKANFKVIGRVIHNESEKL